MKTYFVFLFLLLSGCGQVRGLNNQNDDWTEDIENLYEIKPSQVIQDIQDIPAPILSKKHPGVTLGLPVGLWKNLSGEAAKEMSRRNRLLREAAASGDVETIQKLLKQGVIVNISHRYGKTALHMAAENGRPEACRLLLEAGAMARSARKPDPNWEISMIDVDGMTPADYSVFHVEVLKVFLDAGVPLESRGFMGLTLLQVAVSRDCFDSARFLIERGADIHVRALHAPEMGLDGQNLMDFAESPEMRELLENAGVDRNLPGEALSAALRNAASGREADSRERHPADN